MSTQIASNAARAGLAFAGATADAGNYIDSLMSQYGWQTPGADGSYTSTNAANAFDPNNIMSFGEGGVSNINAGKIAEQASGGRFGGKGVFSDITRTGASSEGDVVSQLQSRGLGTGSGIANQQRMLAESMTDTNIGGASNELFNQLSGQYGNVQKSYSNVEAARVQDSEINAANAADNTSVYDPATTDAAPTAPAAKPSIKDSEIRGTYYRGSRTDRIKSLRGLIADKTLTPQQQQEVQRLLAQSGFKWNIPA